MNKVLDKVLVFLKNRSTCTTGIGTHTNNSKGDSVVGMRSDNIDKGIRSSCCSGHVEGKDNPTSECNATHLGHAHTQVMVKGPGSRHGGHGEHGGPGHSCHSMGSAQEYLRRFFKVGVLILLLLFLTIDKISAFLPYSLQTILGSRILLHLDLRDTLAIILIGLVFKEAIVFLEHAKHEIKMKKPGMMTLVSIAVVSGFLFSIMHYLFPAIFNADFTLEIATLVWVLMLGHYIEAKASINSRMALEELLRLLPKQVHKIVDLEKGITQDIDISDLKVGDIVMVKAGENIPADGVVVKGMASVSNAHVTGESLPITKQLGSNVVAGASVLDGVLYVRVTAVGKDSTVGQLASLLEKALVTTPSMQRLADRVAFYLTFVSITVALLTFLVWYFILGKSIATALTLAISVLVITCPHALGLAIPAVIAIAVDEGARLGVFIKNLAVLEKLPRVRWVVLDKTGTLTTGRLTVDDMQILTDDITKSDINAIVNELEHSNVHPVATALLEYTKDSKSNKHGAIRVFSDSIEVVPGKGVSAVVEKPRLGRVYLGSVGWAKHVLKDDRQVKTVLDVTKIAPNQTAVLFFTETRVLAVFLLSDTIRESAYRAIKELHTMGINVAMLTGDNKHAAEYVASKLGIDKVVAEASPEDKYKFIKELQQSEPSGLIMMVGDGINDSAALVQADVGVAVRSGTDIAVTSADVVLMNNDPYSVVKLLRLGRLTYKKMIQNIFWALGYNVFAIPAAAGVFMPFGISVKPELAALIMSLSTVIVVANALFMRRTKL